MEKDKTICSSCKEEIKNIIDLHAHQLKHKPLRFGKCWTPFFTN